MSEMFENLSEEKRKRIIDACIEEFANNGYDKASTNTIVKKAGISKGLLFHYFRTKKKVFLYTLDYAINKSLEQYYELCKDKPADLFERITWTTLIKVKMSTAEPLMFKLFFNAFVIMPEELKKELEERYEMLINEHVPLLFQGIDTTLLRKDINPQKAIEIVTLFVEGYSKKYMNLLKNYSADEMIDAMEKVMNEFNEYFDILKRGIYA